MSTVSNLHKKPIKLTTRSHLVIIIVISRRDDQTNFSDDELMHGTHFFSVAGDGHNMAATLTRSTTHPINISIPIKR